MLYKENKTGKLCFLIRNINVSYKGLFDFRNTLNLLNIYFTSVDNCGVNPDTKNFVIQIFKNSELFLLIQDGEHLVISSTGIFKLLHYEIVSFLENHSRVNVLKETFYEKK